MPCSGGSHGSDGVALFSAKEEVIPLTESFLVMALIFKIVVALYFTIGLILVCSLLASGEALNDLARDEIFLLAVLLFVAWPILI